MAVNSLSLAASLRPWRYAGVIALLSSEAVDDESPIDAPGKPSNVSLTSDSSPSTAETDLAYVVPEATCRCGADEAASRASPPSTTEDLSTNKLHPCIPETGGRHAPLSPAATANAQDRHAGSELSRENQNNPEPDFPDLLPGPWQDILTRTEPSPIIWTYSELGDDLTGHGDKERSACLRHIIRSLNLPKGTNAFWPVCLPQKSLPVDAEPTTSAPGFANPIGNAGDSSQERFFLFGLRKLNPRIVILLGQQAVELSGLTLSLSTPFTQKIHKGVLYVLLPDFPTLLSKTVLRDQACVFLRSALSGMTLI